MNKTPPTCTIALTNNVCPTGSNSSCTATSSKKCIPKCTTAVNLLPHPSCPPNTNATCGMYLTPTSTIGCK